MSDTHPLPLNPDGTINMTATAIAGHLESTINARWRAMHARSYGDLLGRWVGGRCTSETRMDVLAVLLDLGLGDLHPGLHVNGDVDDDGRPVAIIVSNPRTSHEIAVALTPRALRIAGGVVVPLEIDSAGRRVVESICMAVARIVASPDNGSRRKGRRHDA